MPWVHKRNEVRSHWSQTSIVHLCVHRCSSQGGSTKTSLRWVVGKLRFLDQCRLTAHLPGWVVCEEWTDSKCTKRYVTVVFAASDDDDFIMMILLLSLTRCPCIWVRFWRLHQRSRFWSSSQQSVQTSKSPSTFLNQRFYCGVSYSLELHFDLFIPQSQVSQTRHGFKVGMKLEAIDRKNPDLICVATVTNVIGNRFLVHFDEWDDTYDYWCEEDSPYIHPVGWCEAHGGKLNPPNGKATIKHADWLIFEFTQYDWCRRAYHKVNRSWMLLS